MTTALVNIDSLAAGGDGVGRLQDGRVAFVPFTAPGDRIRMEIVEDRQRFVRGRVETLLEPSPERVDPVCGVFGSCGGCSWQHVSYTAQLEAKRDILRDALQRVGKLTLPGSVEVVSSPNAYGYRTRARVLVEGKRVGFRRRRSHALCPTSRCPVLCPQLDQALSELAAAPPEQDGEWELAQGEAELHAEPLARGGDSDGVGLRVGSDSMRVSPGVFAQGNGALLEVLASRVQEAAGRGEVALELFAGAGFLTLGLARRFEQVHAVESSRRAVKDLRANLNRAGLDNVKIAGVRAEYALASRRLRKLKPDVLVLDPPRTGLAKGLAERLADYKAGRVVHLSCDPATLARDLACFAKVGYRAVDVTAIDLFPQTPHVEALVTMELEPSIAS